MDGQAAKPLLYSLQLYTVTPDCDTSQSSPPKSMTHPHISFQFRATFRIKTAAAVRSWPVTALVMHASLPSPLLSHNSSGGGGGGGGGKRGAVAPAHTLQSSPARIATRRSTPGSEWLPPECSVMIQCRSIGTSRKFEGQLYYNLSDFAHLRSTSSMSRRTKKVTPTSCNLPVLLKLDA